LPCVPILYLLSYEIPAFISSPDLNNMWIYIQRRQRNTKGKNKMFPLPISILNNTPGSSECRHNLHRVHTQRYKHSLSKCKQKHKCNLWRKSKVIQGVSKRALQWYSKCCSVASVTKRFTLKGLKTCKHFCKCFRNTRYTVAFGISL
jgi:hypothetical protein